jgi:hypothetical protein
MTSSKTARKPGFAVRICGIEVSSLTTRLVIRSGGRGPCHEIVFEDPILGVLPLDDALPVEIWRIGGPRSRQKWQRTDVRHLYAELVLSGAIDVVGAGEGEKMA